jgi:hypothetical protein
MSKVPKTTKQKQERFSDFISYKKFSFQNTKSIMHALRKFYFFDVIKTQICVNMSSNLTKSLVTI